MYHGSLNYRLPARSATIEKMAAKITINNNGSIRVEGEFTIQDAEGRLFDLAGRDTVGLCRCGQSENKPFCDGSHRRIGFESVCPARALPPPKPKL
jgi:CDGSH-type Zn-finger protein